MQIEQVDNYDASHYWYMLQDPRLQETIILGDRIFVNHAD